MSIPIGGWDPVAIEVKLGSERAHRVLGVHRVQRVHGVLRVHRGHPSSVESRVSIWVGVERASSS